MRIFFAVLFSIIITVLQLTVAARLAVLAVAPSLILSGVLAVAVWQSERKNAWLILIPILFFELAAGRPFGLFALSLWLMYFFVERMGNTFLKQNDFLAVLSLVFVGLLSYEFFRILLGYVFSIWHLAEPVVLSPFYFYAVLPIGVLYNGILSLSFLWALNNMKILKNHGPLAKIK